MKALNELSIAEARERLDQGAVSSVALTEACLGQIQSLDGALHAFLEVWPDEALQEAKRSDERRSRGLRLGEFDGIPLAAKDDMLGQGRLCSAGRTWTSSPWGRLQRTRPMDPQNTRVTRRGSRAVLPAGARSPWRRTCAWARSGQTPAGPSGSRRRSAASSV